MVKAGVLSALTSLSRSVTGPNARQQRCSVLGKIWTAAVSQLVWGPQKMFFWSATWKHASKALTKFHVKCKIDRISIVFLHANWGSPLWQDQTETWSSHTKKEKGILTDKAAMVKQLQKSLTKSNRCCRAELSCTYPDSPCYWTVNRLEQHLP